MSGSQVPAAAAADYDAIIGENVHQLMWRSRETQTSLAPRLGIGQSALSLKLRGARPWSSNEIAMVALHFRVSIGDLFVAGGTAAPASEAPRSTV